MGFSKIVKGLKKCLNNIPISAMFQKGNKQKIKNCTYLKTYWNLKLALWRQCLHILKTVSLFVILNNVFQFNRIYLVCIVYPG